MSGFYKAWGEWLRLPDDAAVTAPEVEETFSPLAIFNETLRLTEAMLAATVSASDEPYMNPVTLGDRLILVRSGSMVYLEAVDEYNDEVDITEVWRHPVNQP